MKKYLLLVVSFIVMTAVLSAVVRAEEAISTGIIVPMEDCKNSGMEYEMEISLYSCDNCTCPSWASVKNKIKNKDRKMSDEVMQAFFESVCFQYRGYAVKIQKIKATSCKTGGQRQYMVKQ